MCCLIREFEINLETTFMNSKQDKKISLSTLGEFGLIDHLTKNIKLIHKTSITGVGDDAAVLNFPEDEIVVTTDLLLEGVHFNLVYTPLQHLGYKSVVVNLSDICAMNGQPQQITVSLGISSKFSLEDIELLYKGITHACKTYDVDLVGGDTSSSLTGLMISITAIGKAKKDTIVYRNGAKINDLICVTGDLGASYLGLQLLEREREIFEGGSISNPQLEGYEYIVKRQLKPEARFDIIQNLQKKKIKPTSMIDISDGLSSDLLHITNKSQCGCEIYSEKIPISEESIKMAEEFNMDPLTAALNGGEDYELLFTASLKDYEKIMEIEDVHIIGHIVKIEKGRKLITPDNTTIEIRAQGWKHQ